MICLGQVIHTRRRWVSKLRKGRGSVGHWTYWASVMVFGKPRLVMISEEFFDELVEKGVKKLADACRHPKIGAAPPSKTVRQ